MMQADDNDDSAMLIATAILFPNTKIEFFNFALYHS